ncbi:MAG: hypothetical protein ABW185_25120 [Sedimenticola sp.]
MASTERIVRVCFRIPAWYLLTKREEERLIQYILDEQTIRDAWWARELDCSAYCDEQFCFRCATIAPIPPCQVVGRAD